MRNKIDSHSFQPHSALIPTYNGDSHYHGDLEDAQAVEIDNEDQIGSNNESLNENDLKRQATIKALERNNGNRERAAAELGISTRTLYRRIRDYGLD